MTRRRSRSTDSLWSSLLKCTAVKLFRADDADGDPPVRRDAGDDEAKDEATDAKPPRNVLDEDFGDPTPSPCRLLFRLVPPLPPPPPPLLLRTLPSIGGRVPPSGAADLDKASFKS